MITHRRAVAVLALLLIGSILTPRIIPGVVAAGILYVSPVDVPTLTVGSNFSVLIKVANMDPFSGWNIQVTWDQSVINATSLSTSGNILTTNATQGGFTVELVNCINGKGIGCCLNGGCTPPDGPGIASSAFVYQYPTSGNGLLFNMTFHVVSNKPYSPITIQNDEISPPPPSTTFVPHTPYNGYYGTAPDFSLAANPPDINVVVGSSNTTILTLTSLRSFTGKVNVTSVSSGNGITVNLNASQVLLSAYSTREVLVTVQVKATTPPSAYSVTVNTNSSSIFHSRTISVLVKSGPDFEVGASPSDLLTHQSSSNSTTITVESLNHFSGTVYLRVTFANAATASLDNSNLKIPDGGIASTTLRVTTQSSATRFTDTFNVIATNGTLTRSVQVIAEPPPADFQVSANPPYVRVQAGHSEVVTIGVTSADYYVGAVFALGTSQSGVKLSFDPGNFYLDSGQTVFTKLNITTDVSTTAGNHTIELTVIGQFFQTTQHVVRLTLIVSGAPAQSAPQPRTFLGLSEWAFFGLIGGIGIILAVLGALEARRSSRPGRRPILEE